MLVKDCFTIMTLFCILFSGMENKNFLINISHEFKSPVTNLSLLLETLYEYDEILPINEKKEILQLGLKETERLKKLINYFLYPLNLERNKQLKICFKNLNDSYDLIFLYKNLLVKFYIYNFSDLSTITTELYSHIILNLCENSSKFTPDNNWILAESESLLSVSLSSFEYDSFLRSSVVDGGFGFKDKVRSHIRIGVLGSEVNLLGKYKLGLMIVKNILLSNSSQLNGISYPLRGAKLFFNT